jgi:hypothetical protein
MDTFVSMLPALRNGQRVAFAQWDDTTSLFVKDGELMQQATGEPYPYQLSWHEINAAGWRLAAPTSIAHSHQSQS